MQHASFRSNRFRLYINYWSQKRPSWVFWDYREVYDFENTEDLSNKINYLRDNISVAINMGIKIQMKCLSKYNIDIQLDILKEYIKSEYTN